jgi:4-amino-4-deoxy-L-arabinose transferase-like glycosyltransferase
MDSDAIPTTVPPADKWLVSRWKAVLGVILGLAILLRILLVAELWDGPAFTGHLHDQMDTTFFHQTALYITERDAICKERPIHPLHRWHRFVGEAFFEAHPEHLKGPYAGKSFSSLPHDAKSQFVRSLWQEWYGQLRYHQEPFYAYFIAFVYMWTGENVPAIFALQMLVGVLTIALMMGMTRRLFGPLVGALTGLLIVCWGPQMHYELVLLRTTFITFFGVALLYATQRMGTVLPDGKQRSRKSYIWYGVLVGLATATKTTFLLFGIGLVIALMWNRRGDRAALMRDVGWIALGVLIPLLPIFVRNAVVGAPLFSMTSVAAITFAATNLPSFDPFKGWFPYLEGVNLSEIMHTSKGQFGAAVSETLARHDGFSSYLGLLVRKFLAIWHWYELPNNTNFYYISLHSTIFTASRYLVGAVWVMPMALIGLAASGRRSGVRSWWWFLVCSIGPLVVFYTLSRFRAPMMIALMPFAALGIVSLVNWFRNGRWVKAGISVAVFAAMFMFVNRGLPRAVITATDHQNGWTLYYRPKVKALGPTPAAMAKYDEFLALIPASVMEITPGHVPKDIYDAEWSQACSLMFKEVAVTYREAGDVSKAARLAELAQIHAAAVKAYKPR